MSSPANSPSSRKHAMNGSQGEIHRITIRQSANIHDATKRGSLADVERLINASPSVINDLDQFGQTPLHIAAFEGHIDIVELLVNNSASLSLQDKNGWTSLHCAASNRHLSIVERLIEAEADLNVMTSSGTTALHYLVQLSLSDHLVFVLGLMLKNNALLEMANTHGITPLHKACQSGSDGVAMVLLMNGADPNAQTSHKECPIHIACRLGKRRLVEALILNGADPHAIGPDGDAAETARRNGHDPIAEYLHRLKHVEATKRRRKKKDEMRAAAVASQGANASPSRSSGHGRTTSSSDNDIPKKKKSHVAVPILMDLDDDLAASSLTPKGPPSHSSSLLSTVVREGSSGSLNSGSAQTTASSTQTASSTAPGSPSTQIATTITNAERTPLVRGTRTSNPNLTSNSSGNLQSTSLDLSTSSPALAQLQSVPSGEDDDSGYNSMRISTARRSEKINSLMKFFQPTGAPVPLGEVVSTGSSTSVGSNGSAGGGTSGGNGNEWKRKSQESQLRSNSSRGNSPVGSRQQITRGGSSINVDSGVVASASAHSVASTTSNGQRPSDPGPRPHPNAVSGNNSSNPNSGGTSHRTGSLPAPVVSPRSPLHSPHSPHSPHIGSPRSSSPHTRTTLLPNMGHLNTAAGSDESHPISPTSTASTASSVSSHHHDSHKNYTVTSSPKPDRKTSPVPTLRLAHATSPSKASRSSHHASAPSINSGPVPTPHKIVSPTTQQLSDRSNGSTTPSHSAHHIDAYIPTPNSATSGVSPLASPALSTDSIPPPQPVHIFNLIDHLATINSDDELGSSASSKMMSARIPADDSESTNSESMSDTRLPSGRRVVEPLSPTSPRMSILARSNRGRLDRSASDTITRANRVREAMSGSIEGSSSSSAQTSASSITVTSASYSAASPLLTQNSVGSFAGSPTQHPHLRSAINRLPSTEFGPRSVQRVSKMSNRARHSKPFTKFLRDVNFELLVVGVEYPMPSYNPSVNVQEAMIIQTPEFTVEYARGLNGTSSNGGGDAGNSHDSLSTTSASSTSTSTSGLRDSLPRDSVVLNGTPRAAPASPTLGRTPRAQSASSPTVSSPGGHQRSGSSAALAPASSPNVYSSPTPQYQPSSHSAMLFTDDAEPTTWHYKSNFFDENLTSHSHWNIVAYVDLKNGTTSAPMIFSFLPKATGISGSSSSASGSTGIYNSILGLVRTSAGDSTFLLDISDRKVSSLTSKKIIKLMQEQSDSLKASKFHAIKDASLSDELLAYEKAEKNAFRNICSHKVGIVYVKDGQIREEEILTNKHSSASFEAFLQCIGTKVTLKDWAGFDGGLDTKKDRTGKYSVFTSWRDFEIMFHVSTYIPLGSGEEKYVERKKYIANDMTTIVFLESRSTAFKPPTLSGDFLHNFVVIYPSAKGDSLSVSVATRRGTPEYGPSVPQTSTFKLGNEFRDFVLSKIINAERATLHSPMFSSKRRQARQHWLGSLINKYMPCK